MPYLQEAMDSLFAQTDTRFEILAVVDGATDSSLEYLRSIRDPRMRIVTQTNQGIASTLNRILRECRTPWLVRQDADDVSYPNRIARLSSAIASSPDAGMFYSLAKYHPRGAVGTFRSSLGTPEQLRSIVQQGYLLSICHPTVALNVKKTCALGGYRFELHNEDADLWWRMALEHEVHCIPQQLVGFRQNQSSVSGRNLPAQMVGALYVQYLLLSHLGRRVPQPFAAVRQRLQGLLSASQLQAKERLREFNIRLAERKYFAAVAAGATSFALSPRLVVGRLCDEFAPRNPIRNGLPPRLFYQNKEALWL